MEDQNKQMFKLIDIKRDTDKLEANSRPGNERALYSTIVWTTTASHPE